MKKLFLTSSLGTNIKIDEQRYPCEIDNSNNMIEVLKEALNLENKLVLISSNPFDYERNDEVYAITKESFMMSGFNFKEIVMLDQRNRREVKEHLKGADLIILCGGHVPTQNDWFKEIGLSSILKEYEGIIIGQSAGSMNAAGMVYACPELEGEAIDPSYKRWIEGLGLTDLNIFPHYAELINEELDGLKLMDEIVLKDSFERPIYTLNDGSFIEISESNTIIHGECYKISNGIITYICKNGNKVNLT